MTSFQSTYYFYQTSSSTIGWLSYSSGTLSINSQDANEINYIAYLNPSIKNLSTFSITDSAGNYLLLQYLTSLGSITVVGSSVNIPVNVVSSGGSLTVGSSVIFIFNSGWASSPVQLIVNTAAGSSTPGATPVQVDYTNVVVDTASGYNSGMGHYTVTTAGLYQINGSISLSSPDTNLYCSIFVNMAEAVRGAQADVSSFTSVVSGILSLNVNDTVQIYLYSDNAATIGSFSFNQFSLFLI